jgi:hypothetical protein
MRRCRKYARRTPSARRDDNQVIVVLTRELDKSVCRAPGERHPVGFPIEQPSREKRVSRQNGRRPVLLTEGHVAQTSVVVGNGRNG